MEMNKQHGDAIGSQAIYLAELQRVRRLQKASSKRASVSRRLELKHPQVVIVDKENVSMQKLDDGANAIITEEDIHFIWNLFMS
jgi:hypothetical protein